MALYASQLQKIDSLFYLIFPVSISHYGGGTRLLERSHHRGSLFRSTTFISPTSPGAKWPSKNSNKRQINSAGGGRSMAIRTLEENLKVVLSGHNSGIFPSVRLLTWIYAYHGGHFRRTTLNFRINLAGVRKLRTSVTALP